SKIGLSLRSGTKIQPSRLNPWLVPTFKDGDAEKRTPSSVPSKNNARPTCPLVNTGFPVNRPTLVLMISRRLSSSGHQPVIPGGGEQFELPTGPWHFPPTPESKIDLISVALSARLYKLTSSIIPWKKQHVPLTPPTATKASLTVLARLPRNTRVR